MSSPVLSIIIPVYNVDRFLPATLQSILSQRFADYEVLLVDDGSTDNSLAICREYSAKDTRFKVYHQENSGVSHARNLGLEKAKGDYTYFMDADDLLHPQFLEIMMGTALQDNADLVCCEYKPFNLSPKFPVFSAAQSVDLREKGADPFGMLTQAANATSMCSKVIKRSLMNNYSIRFRDGMSFGEDMFVSWKCCLAAKVVRFIRLPLYYYRQSGSSAAYRYHAQLYETYKASFEDVRIYGETYQLTFPGFNEDYARYFAQRLNSFVTMEVKAPYSIWQKKKRLSMIMNDSVMKKGLSLHPGENVLYRYASKNRVWAMLLCGYRRILTEKAKNIIRKVIQ